MSAQRTAHDFEQDVLRGRTLEEATAEAARLASRAQSITDHLSRIHYSGMSVVRQNLEDERNGYEMDAADLEARIAEYTGQIEKVREPAVPMSMRARRQAVAR